MASPTFTLFPRLPYELREMVWRFSLPDPRKIVPFTAYNVDFFHEPNRPPKDHCPANLRVNRDSRTVALRHYSNWHNAAALGYQYIDFDIDTVCFSASDFLSKNPAGGVPEAQSALLKLSRADLLRIGKLEISFERIDFAKDLKWWISRWLVVLFPGVKELKGVWAHEESLEQLLMADGPESCSHWKVVKAEIESARELATDCLEEIEKRKRDSWKAPALSVSLSDRVFSAKDRREIVHGSLSVAGDD
jgi:2EXR family